MEPRPGSPFKPWEPDTLPCELWPSLTGEELADSLLTGEMSLLLLVWLTEGELDRVPGFRGICQDGILGRDGEAGNCLLGERKKAKNIYIFNKLKGKAKPNHSEQY